MQGFGDSSIDLMVRYWTLPQKYSAKPEPARSSLKKPVNRLIFYSLPTCTLYYYNPQQDGDHFSKSASIQLIVSLQSKNLLHDISNYFIGC